MEGVGAINNSDIVKGYEVDKDQYVIIEPDEIDAIKLESKQTIDLVQFIGASEIDVGFFERPFDRGQAGSPLHCLIDGHHGIAATTALRLVEVLGSSAEFWINLQTAHDEHVDRSSPPAAHVLLAEGPVAAPDCNSATARSRQFSIDRCGHRRGTGVKAGRLRQTNAEIERQAEAEPSLG